MNRMRVLNHLYESKIDNAIILSGDSHANWVSDLARKLVISLSIIHYLNSYTDPNDTTTYAH